MGILIFVGPRRRRQAVLLGLLLAVTVAALLFRVTGGRVADGRFTLAGHLIALDPGHGGIDGGCAQGKVLEKDLALDLVFRLRRLLHAAGARVYLTRQQDHDLSFQGEGSFRQRRDLSGRVALVRRSGAEVLVSIHLNAAASPARSGPIVFFQAASGWPTGHADARWAVQVKESERLADLVQEELLKLYPESRERAWPNTFYLLRHSPVPTVLVEVGYLTNPGDRRGLLDPAFREQLARAMAKALDRYFAGERLPVEPAPR